MIFLIYNLFLPHQMTHAPHWAITRATILAHGQVQQQVLQCRCAGRVLMARVPVWHLEGNTYQTTVVSTTPIARADGNMDASPRLYGARACVWGCTRTKLTRGKPCTIRLTRAEANNLYNFCLLFC